MHRRGLSAVVLAVLFLLAPTLPVMEHSALANDAPSVKPTQQGAVGMVDVPNYRIGDEWVYETQFDVAQLLAQANVSASLNTLTGDTSNTVSDILYTTDENGDTVLAYEVTISGSFSSGNSGATLEGVTGRLDIDYDGVDLLRARDLATMNSEFTLDVVFVPFNIGFLSQTLGVVTFDNSYTPAKERHDFPLRNGDQWYMPFNATTEVTGTSDYFDPSDFDQDVAENNSWQVIKTGAPQEGQQTPQYTGCGNSFKIAEWNETGVNVGFNWYCPAVRGSVWTQITNPAGFTIDWILKTYDPADSNSVSVGSSPGGRNTQIEVYTAYSATLPNSMEQISIEYATVGSPSIPKQNTNLQLRYEIADTIHNPTTDSNGVASVALNVSDEVDDTPSSDDHTSNGVVVYDPISKIVGATTVVEDLNVVGVDLIAQSGSVIVERTRAGYTTTLSASIGFNALPGDLLSFSLPAQNRGVLTASATSMEVENPDGTVLRADLPPIQPYAEERVLVNWTVPANMTVGLASLTFTVDPDENVTEDVNRSNNQASLTVFIGRLPVALLSVDEGKSTFENITLDASASFDEDGGDVDCRFEIEARAGLIEVIDAPDCVTQWNWSSSGGWTVKVLVIDEELDTAEVSIEVQVLNRAPTFELLAPATVAVESPLTLEVRDLADIDSVSPVGQKVTVSWPPSTNCGLVTDSPNSGKTCTFIPTDEGSLNITATATDDRGATTNITVEVTVLNIPPTLSAPTLTKGGQQVLPDENGTWHINEDETAILKATASDSQNDLGTVLIEWHPSIADQNWTLTTTGGTSQQQVSWATSGPHTVNVRAIDSDGASSPTLEQRLIVHNVAPTVAWAGSLNNDNIIKVSEDDELLNLTVDVDDTASDKDGLVVCWDFDATVDLDRDGQTDNDCELTGLTANPTWATPGPRTVTVKVTDDDGATATVSKDISVQNMPPLAVISGLSLLEGLVAGDNLTLSGANSIETESDQLTLVYQWGSNHLDSDMDGNKAGDVDFTGPNWTVENLPEGTWTFTLTVTDDDGEFHQADIVVVVAPAPVEGIVESITEALGGTMTAVIGLLAVIIVALLLFLVLTRPSPAKDTDMGLFEHASFAVPPASAPTAQPAAVQPDPMTTPAVALPPMDAQPVHRGPPLPASGLPQGWTMEQWEHYGEQWLAANQPAPAPVQPILSQSPPTPASAELQSLLDDLDF
ncbi:MAG: CARDB domain-containing protein [Poseidonia sp.]